MARVESLPSRLRGREPRLNRLYAMINDPVVRDALLAGAAARFGYPPDKIELG